MISGPVVSAATSLPGEKQWRLAVAWHRVPEPEDRNQAPIWHSELGILLCPEDQTRRPK